MPVILEKQPAKHNRKELIDAIFREWSGKSTMNEPIVLAEEIAQTNTLHVIVVWSRWNGIPERERSAMIMDAYAIFQNPQQKQITIALGATPDEACRMGFFPYRVKTMLRADDTAKRSDIEAAMISEKAVPTDDGPQLLYRNFEDASQAFNRLNTKLPNLWAVVHEQRTEE